MHASFGALDLSPSLFWRSKLRRQRRFCMTFAIVSRRRDYVDHVVGRVRVNEGRDDLIVRGIHVIELHIESFTSKIDETSGPKMRRLIRRAPIWAAVDALSLRSLVPSLFYYFFQWQQKKRRVHFYQYSHQTKQRESNCTRSLSLKP